jgi:hypothetical protein
MNFNSKYFSYSMINQTNLNIHPNIYIGLNAALEKWEKVITIYPLKNKMIVTIYLQILEQQLLGYATPLNVIGNEFGQQFTTKAMIALNLQFLQTVNFDLNIIYSTIVHEFGHVLGIGTFWFNNTSPVSYFLEQDMIKRKYYLGKNALYNYKKYFNNESFLGIPIEDNGGQGTAEAHPEEGDLFINNSWVSTDNRSIDGIIYPGLVNELMTGWLSNVAPMSRVSIGFLEDIGYGVNYNNADYYDPHGTNIVFPLEEEPKWNLPDDTDYNLDTFKTLIGLPDMYSTSGIKILIIDAGFDKNILADKGITVTNNNYKNFTQSSIENNNILGTDVFLTIHQFAPNASYYFAESEWVYSETINEVDNMINAIKWGKENNVDIINISVNYTFTSNDMISKKEELDNIIKSMPNTIIFATGYNKINNIINLPGDVKDIILVGNTNSFTDIINNFTPNLVVPSIIVDNIRTNNSCSTITSICAICMSLRKYITKTQLINSMYESASLNNKKHGFYGYGVPHVERFLELTKNINLINHTLGLNKGWNLVSFPLEQVNHTSAINSLKNNEHVNIIKNTNYTYNSKLSINNLKTLEINSGYWINSEENTLIELNGYEIYEYTFNLREGWNLISCPFYQNINIVNLITSDILEIKYNNEIYNSKIPHLSTLSYLKQFNGYYIKCVRDTIWSLKL